MRQARIFYKTQLAGILTETDAGCEFRYLHGYFSARASVFCLAAVPKGKTDCPFYVRFGFMANGKQADASICQFFDVSSHLKPKVCPQMANMTVSKQNVYVGRSDEQLSTCVDGGAGR